MIQQINLYQYLKKPAKYFLTTEVILLLYGIFLLLLIFNSMYELSKKHVLTVKVNILSSELAKETDNLNQIKMRYPSINLSDLEGSMQKLQQELGSKKEILAILSEQTLFSSYLTALGNSVVQGVWLTEIKISHHGLQMDLKGLTTQASLLQKLLDKLRQQPSFSKMEFHLQEINRIPANQDVAPYVNFYITATTGIRHD